MLFKIFSFETNPNPGIKNRDDYRNKNNFNHLGLKMKLPFFIETQLNKILKPQIITIVETFIDGKRSRRFYGKSLTANFLQWLYAQLNGNAAAFVISPAPFNSRSTGLRADTGAATAALTTVDLSIEAAAAEIDTGILVGSAAVTPAPADFNVGTLITSGVGAGQLVYGTQDGIQGVTIAGQNSSFIIQRTMSNNSGGNVTVQAVAIYTDSIAGSLCFYLDSVSPADVIANGQVYTVQITFQITT